MSNDHESGSHVPPIPTVRMTRGPVRLPAIAGPGLMALALLTLLAHAVASVIVVGGIVFALMSALMWVLAFSIALTGVIATPALIVKRQLPLPVGLGITAIFLCSASMMTIAFGHNAVRTWAL